MSLFRNLTRKELRQVAASSSVRQFAPRNIICKKGTRAKQLFLVLSGEVLECSESNLSQRMFSSGAATGLMSALLGRELDVTWVAGRRGSLIGSIPSYAFGKVIEDHGQEFAETIMQQGLQCLSPARGFCSSAKVNFLSFVLDRFKDSNRLACIRSNLTRSLGLTLLRTCFYGWNLTLLTSQRSRVLSIRRRQRSMLKRFSAWREYANRASRCRMMQRLVSCSECLVGDDSKPVTLEKRVDALLSALQRGTNLHAESRACQASTSDDDATNKQKEMESLREENRQLDAELKYYKEQFQSLRLAHDLNPSRGDGNVKADVNLEGPDSQGSSKVNGQEAGGGNNDEGETSVSFNEEGTIISDLSYSFSREKEPDRLQERLEERLLHPQQPYPGSDGAEDGASPRDAQLVNDLIEQLRSSQLALQSDLRRISVGMETVNVRSMQSQSSRRPWGSVSAQLVTSHAAKQRAAAEACRQDMR